MNPWRTLWGLTMNFKYDIRPLKRTKFKSHLYHSLARWPQANHIASLSLTTKREHGPHQSHRVIGGGGVRRAPSKRYCTVVTYEHPSPLPEHPSPPHLYLTNSCSYKMQFRKLPLPTCLSDPFRLNWVPLSCAPSSLATLSSKGVY